MAEIDKANDAQNPSMKQILETIRGVISGEDGTAQPVADNDDILELTDMVEEDGSITSLKPEKTQPSASLEGAAPVPASSAAPADVLASIDNALDTDVPAAADLPSPTPPKKVTVDTPKPEDITPPADLYKEARPALPSIPVEEAVMPADASVSDVQEPLNQASEEHAAKKQRLISDSAAKASAAALATLMRNLPKHRVDGPSFQSGLTLEALVVEALKPELSAWLDKNLPALVTQLVEKEIKKILPQPEE